MEERRIRMFEEIKNLREKHPDMIPVFLTRAGNSPEIPHLPRHKFLVSLTTTINDFIQFIRQELKLHPAKPLLIYVNNILPKNNSTFAEIYTYHKNPEGAVNMTYSSQNIFGNIIKSLNI